MRNRVSNDPFPQHLSHTFCRAARGRCAAAEWLAKQSHTVNNVYALPFFAAPGAGGSVVDLCILLPRGAAASPSSRASWRLLPCRSAGGRAAARPGDRQRAWKPGWAGPIPDGWDGLPCTSSTDFFGLSVIMSVCLLPVCWCDSWACRSGAALWSVTLYDQLSWRVCSTHHERSLHTRGRVHTDQGDLS